jgi:hypothetical protein
MASETDPAARYSPAPGDRPVEFIIAKKTAFRAIFVAPVLIAIFGMTSGMAGAIAAAVGVAIVAVNFLLAGYVLSAAARVSLGLYHAAALFGFLIRLGLIMATVLIIASVTDVDRLALGISAIASYFILLVWEAVAISRGAERDLEWIH